MSSDLSFEVGPLTIESSEKDLRIEGETVSGDRSTGKADLYSIVTNEGHELTLARIQWATGQEDVRPRGEVHGPAALRNLEGGKLRMSILRHRKPLSWMQLNQARVDLNNPIMRPRKKQASLAELEEGSGMDVEQTLLSLGAESVGVKEDVIDDTGKGRNYIAVVFEETNQEVPLAAYSITRILPLLNEYAGPQRGLL